jgi:hypothetical protein
MAGALFLLLTAVLAMSAVGWFRRRIWGWRLAMAIIATQLLGDFINLLRGEWIGGGVGVIIASALLLFLVRPATRAQFE